MFARRLDFLERPTGESFERVSLDGEDLMSVQLPVSSTHSSFPTLKCAVSLLCCGFSAEPLLAQNLDWAYPHGNAYGQRYQAVDQITPANVGQLKQAWVFNTGTNPGGQDIEENPIEVAGVVYFPDGMSNVFAVNASTGKQIWEYKPATAVT